MKRNLIYSMTALGVIVLATFFFVANRGKASEPQGTALAETKVADRVAAPGLVEPVSEEIKVSAEISGKLKSVLVEEGDRVHKGQTLAILENDDYRAQVTSAEARLKEREATLRRVVNGARDQERREAWESVKEAEAVMENARVEIERRRELYLKGVIAREETDRAEREYRVTKARFEAARERHALIDDDAREEDRSKAEADVMLARAELDEARARFEKSFIRSPIDGLVIHKHLKAGESVSDMRETPVITVADTRVLRVRVDVDETDVSKIQAGQPAYVTADAYGNRQFSGRVVQIGQALGRKNVRTDEPSERVDKKILETLIELDSGGVLPVGLRVDAFILTGEAISGGVR
jgi:ABC exporter DevB family membrane fusion protein